MRDGRLSILQVSPRDFWGGAERVAFELFQSYRSAGHDSRLAVGYRRGSDVDVVPISHARSGRRWSDFWWRLHECAQPMHAKGRLGRLICKATKDLADLRRVVDRWRGREDFRFPGSAHVLDAIARDESDGGGRDGVEQPIAILHCHNLHGQYFDLRALASLSRRVPTVVTLHDAWLLSGHCAHAIGCDRWKTGCGSCPDLSIYPSIRRDATAYNHARKRAILGSARLHVATPCRWLMEKVGASILLPAVASSRVIPYGVDLDFFRPGGKEAARGLLGIDRGVRVLLFAANGIRKNAFKDYELMRRAVAAIGAKATLPIEFIALGDDGPAERVGNATLRFVPFEPDSARVARFYQAADVYLHAARADTFPNAVLESLACGTPVVATAVGGIAEQVRSLQPCAARTELDGLEVEAVGVDVATGLLSPPGDVAQFVRAIEWLLASDGLRRRLGENAASDARSRFCRHRQAADYLNWYREILAERPQRPPIRVGHGENATTPATRDAPAPLSEALGAAAATG